MSLSIHALRDRLNQTSPSSLVERALAMLDSQKLVPSKLNPTCNIASELLALWKTREKISGHTGHRIPGVAELNARLSHLSPNAQVEQYSFDNELSSGSIFIDPASGEFLGDTIVERRAKSQQMLELEAELLQPSRKSA
jgi:hypothetical protein